MLNINEKPKIFLCHSSKDKTFVKRLAFSLKENGIDVWLDEWELKAGDSLIAKIQEAILDCSYLAAVISNNSINSSWVQKELNAALFEELDNNNQVKIIPVLFENCRLPVFLREKLYVDLTTEDNFNDEIAMLVNSIKGHHRDRLEHKYVSNYSKQREPRLSLFHRYANHSEEHESYLNKANINSTDNASNKLIRKINSKVKYYVWKEDELWNLLLIEIENSRYRYKFESIGALHTTLNTHLETHDKDYEIMEEKPPNDV